MSTLRQLKLKKGADFCSGALHHMFEVGKLQKLVTLNLTECTAVDDAVVKAMVKWYDNSYIILPVCGKTVGGRGGLHYIRLK